MTKQPPPEIFEADKKIWSSRPKLVPEDYLTTKSRTREIFV